MKRLKDIVLVGFISVALAITNANAQSEQSNLKTMKLNAGIITKNLKETKEFYTRTFGFGITFENEFYLLMHTPNQQAEISFLLPNHPSQQSLFQSAFLGKGVYLTIEVENVDAEYKRIKALGTPIVFELRDESWGDRHFAVKDPNGVGIDIVTYKK